MRRQQMSRLRMLLLLLPFQHAPLVRAYANESCYFPNGKLYGDKNSQNDFYTACPTSAGNDGLYMCCKTQSPFDDVCNQDGLCARKNDPSLGEVQGLLRSTCTDPSWTSPSCLQLCATGIDYLGNVANATEQYVKQCSDGSWCCEAQDPPLNSNGKLNSTLQGQVDTCCNQGKGVFIKNGIVASASPSTKTTSSSATSTATNTTLLPPTPPPPKNGVPTGAVAGGVVGGVVVLAIIAVGIFCCLRTKRRKRTQKANSTIDPSSRQFMRHDVEEKYGNERYEADGAQMANVIKQKDGPYEADGAQSADPTKRKDGPYEL